MSFYVRKSLRAGPLRFNLSKSGIGVSTGFTGFRIGKGPRGNYVHMGRNGLYYRATLPSGNKSSTSPRPIPTQPRQPIETQFSSVEMKEIESVDVLLLQDSTSADLLTEMNNKHKKPEYWPIVLFISIIMLILMAVLNVQPWAYAVFLPIAGITLFLFHRQDQIRKTVILFYELDSEAECAFQALHDAVTELLTCAQAWHISAEGKITNLNEKKRQAGASSLVQRKSIHLALKTPPHVSTNLSIPAIPVGKQTLYLFPDRILVYENGRVGAVAYSDIQLEVNNTRFIESQSVPGDTQVVGQTWKYVNKKGGPDKRFKDNRQLPIVVYSELGFKSPSGLNELIQVSKPNIGSALLGAFAGLRSTQPVETE